MKRFGRSLIFFIVTITIVSCEELYHESKKINIEVIEKVKSEVDKRITSKFFPPFDYNKPDTKNNKQRFKDFIKAELTSDIKGIYCFDDAIGIDTDYMFSFTCSATTSDKIIAIHGLTIDTLNTDNGFYLQDDFKWWDKERISKLQKYSWTDGNQHHKYFWYDHDNLKAYFFDFDL